MKLYYPITIDLYKVHPLKVMEAQQGNIGRGAVVTLTAGGAVVDPTGETVEVYAKKPDGTVAWLECSVEDAKIKIDFTNQMLMSPGTLQVELRMMNDTDDITTPIFLVNVNKSNVQSAGRSENELPVLDQMKADVQEINDARYGMVSNGSEDTVIVVGKDIAAGETIKYITTADSDAITVIYENPNTGEFNITNIDHEGELPGEEFMVAEEYCTYTFPSDIAVYFLKKIPTKTSQLVDDVGFAKQSEVSQLSEDIATKASAIKETASGETIVVTDSDEEKPLGLAIDGKSEQTRYSGKNLLNDSIRYLNVTEIYFGSKNNTDFPIYLQSGTYTFSVVHADSSFVTNMYVKRQGENTAFAQIYAKNALTFTLDEASYVTAWVYNESYASANDVLTAQIESGSTATEYEPYCGGIPSPSPSYKQEIRNIGKYDEASGKYAVEVKCTGKNWLQNNATSKTESGVTFVVNDDKSVTINGVSTADVYLNLDFMAGGIPTSEHNVVTETEMVASFNNKINGIQMAVGCFDESGKAVNMLSVDTADRTFIYPKTAVKARTYLYIQSGKTFNNVTVYPMIRPVGTDESYEPWKKPITATVLLDEPLRGIGESKDILCYKNSISDIERYIGIVDMSNLNWNRSTSYANAFFYANIDDEKIGSRSSLCTDLVCDTVNVSSTSFGANAIDNSFTLVHTNKQILVRCDTYSDVGAFKTAMQGVKLYYELATPITEEIDIDLGELSMFYPTTILSNDCNANMEVTYIADTKAYIDKKFAELATAMV